MKAGILRAAFIPIFLFASIARARAEEGAKVYANGIKSCVMVLNLEHNSQGSGSLINSGEGYVLTNWHVIDKGAKILVVFPLWDNDQPIVESDKYRSQIRKIGLVGQVVAFDQKVDLAIVKLADPTKIPKTAQSVKFAMEAPSVGSKIVSIGNPGASDAMWIYTPGEVRSVYRKQWVSGSEGKKVAEHDAKIIEATSPTSFGDSGGPCFNDKSEQVGVTQGGKRREAAYSYFIESSEVKNFLKVKKIAYDGTEAMAEAKVDAKDSPPMPEVKTEPKKEAPKVDAAAEEAAKQEKAATNMLNLIKPLVKDPNRKSFAIEKLKQVIKLYPKTEAAKEARQLLGSDSVIIYCGLSFANVTLDNIRTIGCPPQWQ